MNTLIKIMIVYVSFQEKTLYILVHSIPSVKCRPGSIQFYKNDIFLLQTLCKNFNKVISQTVCSKFYIFFLGQSLLSVTEFATMNYCVHLLSLSYLPLPAMHITRRC